MTLGARIAVLGLLLMAGCQADPSPRKLPADAGAVEIAALDSLSDPGRRPIRVALSGVVADPHDGREVALTDPSGTVLVRLPTPIGLPVGARLQVRGLLISTPDGLVVDAIEWLYDSTAVPVRSGGV